MPNAYLDAGVQVPTCEPSSQSTTRSFGSSGRETLLFKILVANANSEIFSLRDQSKHRVFYSSRNAHESSISSAKHHSARLADVRMSMVLSVLTVSQSLQEHQKSPQKIACADGWMDVPMHRCQGAWLHGCMHVIIMYVSWPPRIRPTASNFLATWHDPFSSIYFGHKPIY